MEKHNWRIQYVFESKEDFGGDEIGVNLLLDGEMVAQFGDYYHDKGSDKAEAYAKGYSKAKGCDVHWEKSQEIVGKL